MLLLVAVTVVRDGQTESAWSVLRAHEYPVIGSNQYWHTRINCDNEGAINMSERNLSRIYPGSSCADILMNLRNTMNKMSATIKYQHVDDHMDKYLF